MTKLQEKCAKLLRDLYSEQQPDKHKFFLHVVALEGESARARWAFPAAYLAIGAIALAALLGFGWVKGPEAWKLLGAVVGVFSALLVFWKPRVVLEQEDCVRLLGGDRLTAADLADINRELALPIKRFDETLKLAGAVASFLAAYLLLT